MKRLATPDLRRFGWELEGAAPADPAGAVSSARSADLIIEEVTDGRVRDWDRSPFDGFPFHELQPLRSGSPVDERVLADQRLRLWVGYQDDRPVCIGTLFVDSGLAHLVLGVTLDDARRLGYWTAMARQRLLAAPDLPAAAVFSDMSRPGAQALGFLPITRFTLWRRPR